MGSLSSELYPLAATYGAGDYEYTGAAATAAAAAIAGMSSAARGNRRRRKSNTDEEEDEESLRKDALVLASAMAGADLDNSNRAISPSHIAEEALGHYDDDDYDHEDDLQTSSITREEREPHNSHAHHHASLLLNSPLVTPPTRIYTTSATTTTTTTGTATKLAPTTKAKPSRGVCAGVPHVYHDYSLVPDLPDYSRKKTGGVSQPFPEKLHEMLKEVEGTADAEIVSWLSHGRAFIVKSPKQFTERIMPSYFKQTKLTSFQRQLNLYGFRRLTQGTDAGAYYHEKFLRARPALCQQMVRQKVKGTGHKQPADAKTEPNFYHMPIVGEPNTSLLHHGFQHHERMMEPQVLYTAASGMVDTVNPSPTGSSSSSNDPSAAAMPDGEEVTSFAAPALNDGFYSTSSRNMYSRLPPVTLGPMSPMSPGMRGAAHLLQGIAAGHAGALSMPMESLSTESNKPTKDNDTDAPGTSFLQPRISSSSNFHASYNDQSSNTTASKKSWSG